MAEAANYFSDISLLTYLVVFIAGVATSFTPCIYPLIPIMVGVIGTNQEKCRRKNFLFSFSYVLGMALTFSTLGIIASLTGRLWGEFQSSPLAHLIVGSIVISFALALLDVIPLPTFLLSKVGAGKVRRGGSKLAAFLMGMVSGLVAAPCTLAVLGALLTYVATTQNVVIGATLLFTFALGLGLLLILIGTFAGILSSLPKSEKLMQLIQKVIALALIVLGGYFIFRAVLLKI